MEIDRIIVKFLNREANIQEIDALEDWLRNKDNISIFNYFVKTEYISILVMAEYDVKRGKVAIKNKLKIEKRKRRSIVVYKSLAVAASIALIFTIAFLTLKADKPALEVSDSTQVAINVGSNKAILTLDNGNQVVLEKGKTYKAGKANSNGEDIVYAAVEKAEDPKQELKYNYLTIPKGGQFFVQLSDSTKVWLNSESKLKYPVKFQKGKTRQVELIYGEAFFKVSPSTKNEGAKFQVLTKSQETSVLGTEFNIKAYNDEREIETTLVEGKVQIQKGSISKVLKPNQQSTVSSDSNIIDIKEVDVSQEIAWVQGLFSFNEKSLQEIMTVLSRWYDAEIIFESAEQKKFVFTGIVQRTKSIESILNLIEATSPGNLKFEIHDRTIIIK